MMHRLCKTFYDVNQSEKLNESVIVLTCTVKTFYTIGPYE
jgi:hypothetical protein